MPRRFAMPMALALAMFALAAVRPAGAVQPARSPIVAPAGLYRLDPAHASLRVALPVLGGLYRYGLRFETLSGGFAYDPADWRATRVSIVVDPRSATAARDGVARAVVEDLEPTRFPEIRFESRRLALDADGRGTLSGDLTMRGITRPITLDVAFKGDRGEGADARLSFSGTGRVRRSDFGLTVGRPVAGDVADLVFDVEFVRK